MSQPLDEVYLTWLYDLVDDVTLKNPLYSYWNLMHYLYTKEFLWLIPNDDNRCEDGRYLREEFCESKNLYAMDPDWMQLGCSMLEMLIALSRRLSFMDGGEPREWFWQFMDNLNINITDERKFPESKVEEAINTLIWRTYSYNGEGGLFPLNHPRRDQRDVELWTQMNAYLLEDF